MKKLISVLLSAALLLSVCGIAHAAETDVADTGVAVDYFETGAGLSTSPVEMVERYPDAAEYIYNELLDYEKYIGGSAIDIRSFKIPVGVGGELFYAVVYEHPELFYIDPTTISRSYTSEYDTRLRPTFFFDESEIEEKENLFETAIDNILESVDDSWDDLTKARYLHDTLASQCSYSPNELINEAIEHSAYGLLVNRHGVCQGYALAYEILLDRLGIESTVVTSQSMNHAWNMIEIDGKYYHTDLTWDDPNYNNAGLANHTYFMLSESAFSADGRHYGWAGNLVADDTTYDGAWWSTVDTAIYRVDNKDYYIAKSGIYGTLTARDVQTGAEESLFTINNMPWFNKERPGYYYAGSFSYLSYFCGYFYYNDQNSIYRYLPGGTAETVFTKDASENNDIYGMYISSDDDKLYYTVKASRAVEDVIYELEIPSRMEHYLSKPLTLDEGDSNFATFSIDAQSSYNSLDLLGVQLRNDKNNSMRFVNLASSEVLENAAEYGFVFADTSKDTSTAKLNAGNLTVENGHKFDCTGTFNTMTGGYGTADFGETKYKYVTAALNNIPDDKAVVARFYVIDNDGNVSYSDYTDYAGDVWSGCAARLSELV